MVIDTLGEDGPSLKCTLALIVAVIYDNTSSDRHFLVLYFEVTVDEQGDQLVMKEVVEEEHIGTCVELVQG